MTPHRFARSYDDPESYAGATDDWEPSSHEYEAARAELGALASDEQITRPCQTTTERWFRTVSAGALVTRLLISVRRYALASGDVVFVIERTSGTDYVYCRRMPL